MSLLNPPGALATRNADASPAEALAGLPAKAMWRSAADKPVRDAWKRGDHAAAWDALRRQLKKRDRWDALAAGRRGGIPLAWGVGDEPADLAAWLETLTPRRSKKRPQFDLAAWLEQSVDRPADARFALECVALADAAPGLAADADADTWWRLADTLLAVAREAAAAPSQSVAEAAVVHQLLAGELPLALACSLPEVRPLHALLGDAAGALGEAIERLTDGEGMPHADAVPVLPLLLACWTRCAARAEAIGKRPWSADAQTQFEWLVRQSLRLADRDGRLAFDAGASNGASGAGPGAGATLAAALELAGDDEDEAAAARRLKGYQAETDSDPPEPSVHSEWAGVTVLATGWSDRAPRLAVLHDGRTMRVELSANRRVLLAGDWPIDATIGGRPVAPTDDWDVACWYSDEDCDYLELSIDLGGQATLERQLLMARNDGVAMLGEILLTGEASADDLAIATRLPLAAGVGFAAEDETRDGWLTADDKPAAGVLPLALPEWRIDPECGSLEADGERLACRVERPGRNLASALWLDLAPKRFGKQRTWRRLAVAESLRVVPHDVAVGFRVQSGPDQWLAYRSLGPRANRTVIGQNLSSEMLVGRFLPTGEVDEYFEIDEE